MSNQTDLSSAAAHTVRKDVQPEKLLFLDIDGTLAFDGDIPEENFRALEIVKSKGYLPFICTGRPSFYSEMLFGDTPYGMVCNNGSSIYAGQQQIYAVYWPRDIFETIQKAAVKNDCGIMLNLDDGVALWRMNEKQTRMIHDMYPEKYIHNFEDLKDPISLIRNVDLYVPSPETMDILNEELKDVIILNSHLPHPSGDCSLADMGKGNALKWLQQHYNVPREECYAFGDGYNDISMFEEAGHRIAMGNGVDVLKNMATYITTDQDKHGIINAMLHENLLTPDEYQECLLYKRPSAQ